MSIPPVWRERPGQAVTVAIYVTIAAICIVFAVISSAHRADVVAVDHERRLFATALADRQAELQRQAEFVARSDDAYRRLWMNLDERMLRQMVGLRLANQAAHTLVLLIEPQAEFVHAFGGPLNVDVDWLRARPIADLVPILSELALAEPGGASRTLHFLGHPAIVAAVPLRPSPAGAKVGLATTARLEQPMLVIADFLSGSLLEEIGGRLKLPNLRLVENARAEAGDPVHQLDTAGPPVQVSWTPNRPGADIIRNVLPFIGVALACFILLAGFAFRYMRRADASVADSEDRLRHMALHDPLSGLANRMLFNERLETLLAQVKSGGAPSALLSIDLDRFKDVNDMHGHHVGDALIAAVARRLSGAVRESDTVARLGGDEFAVLTSEHAPEALLDIGQRIVTTLSAPYMIGAHTLVIGASIGIVVIDGEAGNSADILRFADIALYRAKNEGRNRACLYDAEMNADLIDRKQLEQDLRLAVARGGLSLAYQAQVTPDGERLTGVEALCRWRHPQRGLVPPSEFIPIAEQSDLIVALGEWVLREACRQGRQWPGVMLAVNVSPLQFRRPDFVDLVQRVLAETGLEPQRLELELTESTLLGNLEGAASAMAQLKQLGVKLALDDFGTGYSSLLYLRRLPFDKLKIDRSFVNNIETAPEAAAIVHAIVSLGRGLRMKVTAEGVENAEQQLFLRAAGVHSMQGFRFGRPMEAADVTARLQDPADDWRALRAAG